jgi:hypothetical protein
MLIDELGDRKWRSPPSTPRSASTSSTVSLALPRKWTGTSLAGPHVRWIGRRHGRRQDRCWAASWSPEQIVHRLQLDFPDDPSIRISHEAIYQALFVQGRGALRRELESAIRQAENDHEIVLEAEQRRAIATALTRQVSSISGGPGVGKTTSVRILVELLERRGVTAWRSVRAGVADWQSRQAALRSHAA